MHRRRRQARSGRNQAALARGGDQHQHAEGRRLLLQRAERVGDGLRQRARPAEIATRPGLERVEAAAAIGVEPLAQRARRHAPARGARNVVLPVGLLLEPGVERAVAGAHVAQIGDEAVAEERDGVGMGGEISRWHRSSLTADGRSGGILSQTAPRGQPPSRVGGPARGSAAGSGAGRIRAAAGGSRGATPTRPRSVTSTRSVPQASAERAERRVADQQAGEHAGDDHQRGPDERQATTNPAHGRGQVDVGAQRIRRRFDAARRPDVRHHAFEIVQVAREATREAVRQEAEGLMRRGTVVPRDLHPRRRLARVGAMAGEATAPARMARTHGQTCLHPGVLGKIGLAGQRSLVTQLHRPAHATVAAVTSTASLPRRCSSRRRGRFLSQRAGRATAHTAPCDPLIPQRSNPRRTGQRDCGTT